MDTPQTNNKAGAGVSQARDQRKAKPTGSCIRGRRSPDAKPKARDKPDRSGVMTARDAGAEVWCFWLPIPPSVNEIWTPICRNGRGAFVTSKKYKAWKADASAALTVQDRPRDPLYGHITVAIDVPDTEKRDIDNLEKATLDILESAGILEDDKHVRHLGINRALDPGETEIRLHVRRYL